MVLILDAMAFHGKSLEAAWGPREEEELSNLTLFCLMGSSWGYADIYLVPSMHKAEKSD